MLNSNMLLEKLKQGDFEKPTFGEILDEELSIYCEKNAKYGNSFAISVEKYGLISALTRISDKFNRLETLILNNDNGTPDERLEDTLMDLANYCNMTLLFLREVNNNDKT